MRTQWWWTLALVAACGSGDPAAHAVFDPCVALTVESSAASELQHAAIADALTLWRDRGVTAFDAHVAAPTGAPDLVIAFEPAAETFHGIYEPDTAQVLINRALTERQAIAVVIAHELGHAFGLVHIDPDARRSLMNPGNLITPPTDDDQRALEAMWGACPTAVLARPRE